MTKNEITTKLAAKQALLLTKTAECTVLRSEIAALKAQQKPAAKKPATKAATKPATKPTTPKRKTATKK